MQASAVAIEENTANNGRVGRQLGGVYNLHEKRFNWLIVMKTSN